MDIFAEFRATVLAALDAMDLPDGLKTDGVSAEPPRDASRVSSGKGAWPKLCAPGMPMAAPIWARARP
jgi:hypothetical protein